MAHPASIPPASRLAVSCGDPAGIGPDVILTAYASMADALPPFHVHGDPDQLRSRAGRLGLDVAIAEIGEDDALPRGEIAVRRLPLAMRDAPGETSVADAPAIIDAIDRAVADVLAGRAAALVTCPIAKKTLYEGGFGFPGHTEYLGHLAQEATGRRGDAVMMIAGPDLRVVPVTIHIPLAEVPTRLTSELIVATGNIVAEDLAARFDIARPRLAVAGLNPHAGEDGTLGVEDLAIVAPAVRALRAAGIDATGPLPADTMFHARARAGYDAALCMYHDQALIPAKALAFDEAVNVTLGLPFIRTSPDHGTAFGIAGTGQARPDSFIAAMRMAARMAGIAS